MKLNLPQAGNKRILVVGDLMLDHYMWGECSRISPEAPVPIVDIQKEEIMLGGAGNVIKNLKSFGVHAGIISVIGDDLAGEEVTSILQAGEVSPGGLFIDKTRHTTRKTRVLALNHQMIRIDKETKTDIVGEAQRFIADQVRKQAGEYDVILLSDYLKGVLTPSLLKEIILYCRKIGKMVIADPKGGDYSKYFNVNIIKPNKREASIATGIEIKDRASLDAAIHKLQQITNCDHVVITLSEDGIAVSNPGVEIIPTKATEVFDVTGAGDTVLASLGISMACGLTIYDACVFANHAAAIVVSKIGSASTTIEEVLNHIIIQDGISSQSKFN